MNPFRRKSRFKKLLESVEGNDTLKGVAITAAESAVAGATSRRQAEKISEALRMRDTGSGASGGLKSKARSGLMMAAGAAAVVATSASISSIRRRNQEES